MDVNDAKPLSRRGFLDWIVAICSAISGAALSIPALMYMWPAARGDGVDNVKVDGANDLSPGEAVTLQVGSQAVIVVRDRKGFKAFSAVCTHLGCLVEWDSANKRFLCPCHAAVFDEEGAVVSGPPPAALPTFKVKEIKDEVFVSAA